MSTKSKNGVCYSKILKQIDGIEAQITRIKNTIVEMTASFDDEEECPDVVESEKALIEAIEKLYVEELLTREPEGDA